MKTEIFQILVYATLIAIPSYISCSVYNSSSPAIIPPLVFPNNECGIELLSDAKSLVKSLFTESSYEAPLPMFNYTRSTRLTDCYGTTTGSVWDDGIHSHQPLIVGIQSFMLSYDTNINSLQVTYRLVDETSYTAPRRGILAGSVVSVVLSRNERLVEVQGMENPFGITQLKFVIKNAIGDIRYAGPYGNPGQKSFNIQGYILGFRGRSGIEVNSLCIYYLSPLVKSNVTIGGTGRSNYYDDDVDSIIPPIVGIKNITIRAGSVLVSIKCTYILLGGAIHEGNLIGNNGGGIESELTLEDDEILYRLVGRIYTYSSYLDHLELYTRRGNTSEMHGPYGWGGGIESFEFSGIIMGFHGYTEDYSEVTPRVTRPVCSSIGVYTLN